MTRAPVTRTLLAVRGQQDSALQAWRRTRRTGGRTVQSTWCAECTRGAWSARPTSAHNVVSATRSDSQVSPSVPWTLESPDRAPPGRVVTAGPRVGFGIG